MIAHADIEQIALAHQRRLIRIERAAAVGVTREFAAVWQATRREIESALSELEDARAIGASIELTDRRLAQELETVRRNLEMRLSEWLRAVDAALRQAQQESASFAVESSRVLILSALGTPPPGANAPEIATAEPEPPLLQFGEDGARAAARTAAYAVERSTLAALAATAGVGDALRAARRAAGAVLSRALGALRSAVAGAYRSVARQTYQRNDHVLEGWVWVAARDPRCCMACIAMHGTVHPLHEPLREHPRGLCIAAPLARAWSDLGYPGAPDTRPRIETGEEWFARQPETVQRSMLGPAKYRLWRQGQLRLSDIVGKRAHRAYGEYFYERSLRELERLHLVDTQRSLT